MVALQHPASMMMIFAMVLGLNFYLYSVIPKGFFPQQDTGQLVGFVQADQSISFQLMQQKLANFVAILRRDPAVETVVAITPVSSTNTGLLLCSLYPRSERHISADQLVARLRHEMDAIPGAAVYMQSMQDFRVGGRASN